MGGILLTILQRPDGWYFVCNGQQFGPYSTREMAELKYQEYTAYVVTAPGCHHA